MSDKTGASAEAEDAALQFDTAEPVSVETGACQRCQQALRDEYYEVAGHVVCRACGDALTGARVKGAFVRALLYGGGAALLGSIIWFAIIKLSGREFGLLAIAVGLVVGLAVRKGAGGQSGAKYQVLAMALTYVSITASYVPMVLNAVSSPQAAETQSTTLLVVLGLAFASPFLGGFDNIMGIIIIGIGLYEAWKINKRVPVNGPFRLVKPAAPPSVAIAP